MERNINKLQIIRAGVGALGLTLSAIGVMDMVQMETQVQAKLAQVNPQPERMYKTSMTGKGPIAIAIPSSEEEALIAEYGGATRKVADLTTIFVGGLTAIAASALSKEKNK